MPSDYILRRASRAAELLESQAFKEFYEEREEEIKGAWAIETDKECREQLWLELQGLYLLRGRLEADVHAPVIAEQTEKRLRFDQRI